MGIFDDVSLDDRARPIIVGHGMRVLGDASLEAAALLDEAPSPAMVEGAAEWIEIASELAAAGLSPLEALRVCVRATTRVYGSKEGPSEETFAHLFARPAMTPFVAQIVEEVSASTDRPTDRAMILAAVAPRAVRTTPTDTAQKALDSMLRRHREARAVRSLDTFVEWAYTARRIAVDAPELATLDAWTAASEKRQLAIATSVGDGLRRYLDHGDGGGAWKATLASFDGPPIAVLARGKRRFSLVPGGTVEVGFSEEEEAAVRAQAEINAGCKHHRELYEALFDTVDTMRPLVRVTVGPMLVMQEEPEAIDRKVALGRLVESLFRVPSEAEWEHLARGGRSRELTYRGDVVPDSRDEYLATLAGEGTANAFGLWGFGLQPELCADAWSETHDDLPVDGAPRRGPGWRVVRGGAAMLSPWQDTGEWHMLLTAFRVPDITWKHALATRYVLGIECRAT
jgi:hypothetical protein